MKVIKLKNLESQHPYTAFFNFTGIVIDYVGDFIFYKNSKYHNEYGPSKYITINEYNYFPFYYYDNYYGENFTIKTWKQKVKQFKREERLNIFK